MTDTLTIDPSKLPLWGQHIEQVGGKSPFSPYIRFCCAVLRTAVIDWMNPVRLERSDGGIPVSRAEIREFLSNGRASMFCSGIGFLDGLDHTELASRLQKVFARLPRAGEKKRAYQIGKKGYAWYGALVCPCGVTSLVPLRHAIHTGWKCRFCRRHNPAEDVRKWMRERQ